MRLSLLIRHQIQSTILTITNGSREGPGSDFVVSRARCGSPSDVPSKESGQWACFVFGCKTGPKNHRVPGSALHLFGQSLNSGNRSKPSLSKETLDAAETRAFKNPSYSSNPQVI